MAQTMMWDQVSSIYRGQSTNGTVVSVDQDVMEVAIKRAGKSVFDSDWWVETLEQVLEHWGVETRRWQDGATLTPRLHFSISKSAHREAGN